MLGMTRRAATKTDVEQAIKEGRLRVDRTGRVETKRGDVAASWRKAWLEKVAPPGRPDRPYLRASFSTSEGSFRCLVHRLVWWAHGNGLHEGEQLNHINGDKIDNRLENLEACTNAANMRHAYDVGLKEPTRGRAHASRAKLTDAQVQEIRGRYARGEAQSSLAKAFGVTQSQVSRVVHRKSYRYVG